MHQWYAKHRNAILAGVLTLGVSLACRALGNEDIRFFDVALMYYVLQIMFNQTPP